MMKLSSSLAIAWQLFLAECLHMLDNDEAENRHYRMALAISQTELDACSQRRTTRIKLRLVPLLLRGDDTAFSLAVNSLPIIRSELEQQDLSVSSSMARAWMYSGLAAERSGDERLAVTLYKKSDGIFLAAYCLYSPDHIRVLDLLANLLVKFGRPEEAESYRRRAMALRRLYSGHRFTGVYR